MTTTQQAIPEDIMKAAEDLYAQLWAKQSADIDDIERGQDVEAIASAILAERMLHYDARWANKAVDDVKASFAGALWEIRAERQRQVDDEGWTAEHDDSHANEELALAACVYAMPREEANSKHSSGVPVWRVLWPWDAEWLKPTDRRRDLVKAGALIVAEIERLDRAAISKGGE